MSLEPLAAGAVVPGFQILDAVHSGALDAGYFPGSYAFGKHVAFAFMATIPFGFAPREHLAFRQRPEVKAIFDSLISAQLKLNVVVIPCGSFSRFGEVWTKTPLRTTADLKGMKLRFVGLAADIYKEVGVAVVILPNDEIVSAMERRVIDGAGFGPLRNAELLGITEVAKYYYHPGVVAPSLTPDFVVNKSKWDQMSPAGRQIIEHACRDTTEAMLAEQESADRAALAKIAGKGITVAPLPAVIEKDLYAASRKVLTKLAAENETIRALIRIVDDMAKDTLAATLR
jgi:TRAP-type mannitol/chloroaromatic compound transport system substrate-binding protein